jgi:hypothetical protein
LGSSHVGKVGSGGQVNVKTRIHCHGPADHDAIRGGAAPDVGRILQAVRGVQCRIDLSEEKLVGCGRLGR